MKYDVTFPHIGRDGSQRTPGQTVELDDDEAQVRVADGFVREHRPRRPQESAKQTPPQT